MEDVVYTLPEPDPNDYKGYLDPEAQPMRFKAKQLPEADTSSGVVRFGSVTPKQRFIKTPNMDDMDLAAEVQSAAWKHRILAAEHIAAALWIAGCAPILKEAPGRVTKHETARVTIPVDHEHVTPEDFRHALRVAGSLNGVHPESPKYLGRTGNTGDGRPQHIFEVEYTWTEEA